MKVEQMKAKPDNAAIDILESKILKELSEIRDKAGKACKDFLRFDIHSSIRCLTLSLFNIPNIFLAYLKIQ